MKRIVVYQSCTGFTEQYAKWIAEALKCEAKALKKVKKNELMQYDQIIYGGWIMANMISGYNKIKSMNLDGSIVFGVGMSSISDKVGEKIIEANQLGTIPFFYFEGGVRPEKLGFLKRQMLKMVKSSLEKKEDKTQEEMKIIRMLSDSCDCTNPKAIENLIQYTIKNKRVK